VTEKGADMELLLDYTNVRNFFRIVSNIPGSCSRIRSAIAFNSDSLLIDEAVKKKIPLEWWGLFDFQDSTKYELVKKSLEHKDLISFFPVKNDFHSKIIHFENYGVYIGSGNMTNKALFRNTECGVFLDNTDILTLGLETKLDDFFRHLRKNSREFSQKHLDAWKNHRETYGFAFDDDERLEPAKAAFDDMTADLPENTFPNIALETEKKKTRLPIEKQAISISEPDFERYKADIVERQHQQASFQEISEALRKLIVDCANGLINGTDFYEKMKDLWYNHASRFQGKGFERTGKAADWGEVCGSLARILDCDGSNIDLIDKIVSSEKDFLQENWNPVRRAWLSEMLCHFYPDLYPLLNRPIDIWLKNKGWRVDKDVSEGDQYVNLARSLRVLVSRHLDIVKNLAELDIVLRYDSGM